MPNPLVIALALSLALPGTVASSAHVGDGNPSVAPGAAKAGVVQQWKAADGLAYEYRVPKGYDSKVGANLTLVLHGNGLDHQWTFWNHPHDEFRPHDLVVSPDGTTAHAGTGANEFLGGASDVARVKALIVELKAVWNVRQVFLYGHSQGAFFVFHFAGAEPELIDGVVGHAGGVWNGTETPKQARHQAIGFLHGTEDHVPYVQSVGGRRYYTEDQKYPLVHLRTLFDWDHRPHWYQAAQVLAWCEGMTSAEPARVTAALEDLAETKRPMGVDWSALHDVASRLATLDGASDAQRARGAEVAGAVDALAAAQAADITKGAGKKGLGEFTAGPWSGRLARFCEDFHGTPAWQAFTKKHGAQLEAVRERGAKAVAELYEAIEQDDPRALDRAVELVQSGYLDPGLRAALTSTDDWLAKTRARVPTKARSRYQDLAKEWRAARKDGFHEFEQDCGKVKL